MRFRTRRALTGVASRFPRRVPTGVANRFPGWLRIVLPLVVLVDALLRSASLTAAGAPFGSVVGVHARTSTAWALQAAASAAPPPLLSAPAAVLQDLDSGQVLLSMASRERRPIASLTKIMSAIVALEQAPLGEAVVVSAAAAAESGAEVGLVAGERISIRNLLYAMLLQSANDAAVAVADHVAGSEPAFVELMNRRARELGLRDTLFFSATGLDDRGYSTASDVAAMTREAYTHPAFEGIVRTSSRTIRAPTGPDRVLENRNELLSSYPGAIGVKTGMTSAAGYCVVGAADRDGVRLVAVVLGHPINAFGDAEALLDHGHADFESVRLARRGEPAGTIRVEGVDVTAVVGADLRWLLPEAPAAQIERTIRPAVVAGQVRAGDHVGELVIRVHGRRIGSVPLVAAAVPVGPSPPRSTPSPAPPFAESVSLAEAVRLLAGLMRDLAGAFL